MYVCISVVITGSRKKKTHLERDLILEIPTYLEIDNSFLFLFFLLR